MEKEKKRKCPKCGRSHGVYIRIGKNEGVCRLCGHIWELGNKKQEVATADDNHTKRIRND